VVHDDLANYTFTDCLAGFFYVSQLAVAQMRLQKFGHVVNISSSLVSQPIAGVPAILLNLTKAGLESARRALAIEFAAEGIRFNAIVEIKSSHARHGDVEDETSSLN
jgi:NAD(P)-dependent dehydrogenase (short-subunit alcohol dehydrogenase family)